MDERILTGIKPKTIEQGISNNKKTINTKIKMDEMCKMLFFSSTDMTLNIINFIFDEQFKNEEVIINKENIEFIEDMFQNMEIIRGDAILKITNIKNNNKNYFHIEFQTINDKEMIFRMNQYALNWVREKLRESKYVGINNITYPQQCVIFFEEDNDVKETLKQKINIPYNNQSMIYEIPVVRFWECNIDLLVSKKVYTLIPLKLFNLRKKIDTLSKRKNKDKLKESLKEVMSTTEKILNITKNLYDDKLISKINLDNMVTCISNIFNYYNIKYYNDNKAKGDVDKMIQSVIKQRVDELLEPAIKQGVKESEEKRNIKLVSNAISLLGTEDNELLSKLFGISVKEVISIRNKINK